jgi:hypothetical protein
VTENRFPSGVLAGNTVPPPLEVKARFAMVSVTGAGEKCGIMSLTNHSEKLQGQHHSPPPNWLRQTAFTKHETRNTLITHKPPFSALATNPSHLILPSTALSKITIAPPLKFCAYSLEFYYFRTALVSAHSVLEFTDALIGQKT